MTDGQRRKFEDDQKALQSKMQGWRRGDPLEGFYAAMSMVLGAVLGDVVLSANYEDVMRVARQSGGNRLTSWTGDN